MLLFRFFVNEGASVLIYKGMSTDVSPAPSNPSPAPVTLPLPQDVPTLHAMILELLEALEKSQHDCAGLQQRLDQLCAGCTAPRRSVSIPTNRGCCRSWQALRSGKSRCLPRR